MPPPFAAAVIDPLQPIPVAKLTANSTAAAAVVSLMALLRAALGS